MLLHYVIRGVEATYSFASAAGYAVFPAIGLYIGLEDWSKTRRVGLAIAAGIVFLATVLVVALGCPALMPEPLPI